MRTLKFTREETHRITILLKIEQEAKKLAAQNGHYFKLNELKDRREISGTLEDLQLLQEKLSQADLPTGEITQMEVAIGKTKS